MNLSPNVAQFFSAAALFQLLKDAVTIKRGVPTPLPPGWYMESPSARVVGTQVGYFESDNNRSAAKAVSPGSPSRPISDLPGSRFKTATGFIARENYDVSYEMLYGLESGKDWFVDRATIELKRNADNAASRMSVFRNDLVHSVLALGAIYVDGDGTVLPNSTGAKQSLVYSGVAANTLTTGGAGGTTAIGDWSSAGTKIGLFLRQLQLANLQATGYELSTIYYGIKIPEYLAANTTLNEYFKRHQGFRDSIVNDNKIPDGFMGFNWSPVWKAFNGSTGAAWFDENFLGITPELSEEWYEVVPLGQIVPASGVAHGLITTNTDAVTGAMHAVRYGYHSYAFHTPDPYQMKVVNGYGVLPVIKVPKTIYRGLCA